MEAGPTTILSWAGETLQFRGQAGQDARWEVARPWPLTGLGITTYGHHRSHKSNQKWSVGCGFLGSPTGALAGRVRDLVREVNILLYLFFVFGKKK